MANRLKMRILLLLSLVYINCDYLQAQTTIPRFEEGERVVFVALLTADIIIHLSGCIT